MPVEKRFNTMENVGKVKYLVNYQGGIKKHKDGSLFCDIATFKNKKKRDKFVKELRSQGYVEQQGYMFS